MVWLYTTKTKELPKHACNYKITPHALHLYSLTPPIKLENRYPTFPAWLQSKENQALLNPLVDTSNQ